MPTDWHPDLLIPGNQYRVHVNLHNGKLAVAKLPFRQILCYVDDIVLAAVTFVVQERCVDKIEQAGVRQVCAYARGRLVAVNIDPPESGRKVRYNPLESRYFHDPDTRQKILIADRVVFVNKHAYIVPASDYPAAAEPGLLLL